VFSLDSNELTINKTGKFAIEYRVSIDASGGTNGAFRTTCEIRLERDTGGGFVEVPGAKGFTYNRDTNEGQGSVSVRTVLDDVVSGHKFRVVMGKTQASSSSMQSIAFASGVTVEEK
jgi:hypothetical protein